MAAFYLMIASFPFYFIGLYSMKNLNGEHIIGSFKLWSLGLTRDIAPYSEYIDGSMPGMLTTAVVVFILSLLFNIFFVIFNIYINFSSEKNRSELQLHIIEAFIAVFSFSTYFAGFTIIFLFYTSSHASFARNCSAHLGIGSYFVIVLQFAAISCLIVQLAEDMVMLQNRQSILVSRTAPYRKQGVWQKQNEPNRYARDLLSGYIVFTGGDYKNSKIEMKNDDEIIIGRDPSQCSVVLSKSNQKISRKHCGVIRKEHSFYITDYSKNGLHSSKKGELSIKGSYYKLSQYELIRIANTDNEFYCELAKKRRIIN